MYERWGTITFIINLYMISEERRSYKQSVSSQLAPCEPRQLAETSVC